MGSFQNAGIMYIASAFLIDINEPALQSKGIVLLTVSWLPQGHKLWALLSRASVQLGNLFH